MNELLKIAKKAEKAFNEAVEADKRIWKVLDKATEEERIKTIKEQELIKQIAINLSNANLRIIYEKYGYVEQLETFEFEKEAGYNPSGDEIKEWHEAVKNFLSSEIEPGVTLKNIIEFFYNIKESKYGIILNRRLVEDYICYNVQIENKVYLDIDSKEDDDLFDIGETVKIEKMNDTLVIMKRDELIKEETTLDPERHWKQ